MQSKFIKATIISVILALLILIACSNPATPTTTTPATTASSTQSIKLIASSSLNEHHVWIEGFGIPFMDKVESTSGGRVKFDRYYAGQLANQLTATDALLLGTLDMNLTSEILYFPDRFPLAEVTMLPILAGNAEQINSALVKLFEGKTTIQGTKTWYDMVYGDMGFVAWPIPILGPYVLSTVGPTFTKTVDFKGKNLRGSTRIQRIMLEFLGATPVTISSMEMYDALSRGTIDGTVFSIADWSSYSLQDGVLKYNIMGVGFGFYNGGVSMTQSKWNSLPQDIRDMINKAAKETLPQGVKHVMSKEEPNITSAKNAGAVFEDFSTLTPEVKDAISQALDKTWDTWIDEMNKKGLPGLETARLWRTLVIEAGGTVTEHVKNL